MPLKILESSRAAWTYAGCRSLLQSSHFCRCSPDGLSCKIRGFSGGAQALLQALIFLSELYVFRFSKYKAASVRAIEPIACLLLREVSVSCLDLPMIKIQTARRKLTPETTAEPALL